MAQGSLSIQRADETHKRAYRALAVAQQQFEEGGTPALVDAQFHEAVLKYLRATRQRIGRYQQYLHEQAHDAKELEEGEARQLAEMLAEIAMQLFPEPTKTFLDAKDSLAARVTQLNKGTPGLGELHSAIIEARREVAILLAWHKWYRKEATHDPGGMFTALRHRYEKTQTFANNLDAIADAFNKLYTLATGSTNRDGSD
jgi:hypothetical protein